MNAHVCYSNQYKYCFSFVKERWRRIFQNTCNHNNSVSLISMNTGISIFTIKNYIFVQNITMNSKLYCAIIIRFQRFFSRKSLEIDCKKCTKVCSWTIRNNLEYLGNLSKNAL